MIGALINIGATLAASYTMDFWSFLMVYGAVGGFGVGFAVSLYLSSLKYIAPILAGWLHFPDRKGLVSGIILCGFGLGLFIYNIVSRELVNPL